jgi:LPXTG-motif cell wall-anchored protein
VIDMSGTGYTCTGTTCVAGTVLAAGFDGPEITVVATVTGSGAQRNVAYVDKAPGDGDEVVPLGPVPAAGTDTGSTPTDNDAQADLVVTDATLPHTGADPLPILTIGLGLLLAGGMILLLLRRTPRRARQD